MSKSKQLLIYIRPPLTVSERIFNLNKFLSNRFHNTYLSHLENVVPKWESHLMLYLSPMPQENIQKILAVVKLITKKTSSFKVKFGHFETDPASKYIFIKTDEESRAPINKIREELVDKLKIFRGKTIKQKYLKKWDSFTKEEQERIKNAGLPYIYQPHITVARLESNEIDEALKLIADKSFKGESFIASEVRIAQANDDLNALWSVLASFKLSTS